MIKRSFRSLLGRLPKSVQGWLAYRLPCHDRTYGQFGEDLLLAHYLSEQSGFYVDVGAFHPKYRSNTYALWRRGWRGINVDVDQYKIAQFNKFRPQDTNLVLGVSSENGKLPFYFQEGESYGSMSSLDEDFATDRGRRLNRAVRSREIDVVTLNELLEQHMPKDESGQPGQIDLVNIDVEGHELKILSVFDFERFQPKCMCVEIHAIGLEALAEDPTFQLLQNRGYDLLAWPSPSCIFVRKKPTRHEQLESFRIANGNSVRLRRGATVNPAENVSPT